MKKIASFTVNHDTLEKGMYISRIDGDVVTYDIRMKKPNAGDYFCMSAAHTLEHLFATYARNSEFGTHIIYVKDKSAKHPENLNGGLLTYPVLMAADILAYNAAAVPVGIDQKQHVELARNIAQRFNSVYGETFVMPEAVIPKVGAKIMSLQDPTKKMSKSDENVNATILLSDDKDAIMRKFKRAVTDSDGFVKYDVENKPGVSNLMGIYNVFTGKSFEEIEKEFEGQGYGVLKEAVGQAVVEGLAPIQGEYNRILSDKAYLESVMKDGAMKAQRYSQRILDKVYRKVGFVQLKNK